MTPIRVAVVGLGSWGECHVQALQALPQAEIVAVYDASPQRTEQIAARYGVPGIENLESLWARDDVDLVGVATPEAHHLDAVLRALHSGKHVLVEKPISTRPEDARAMQRAAHETGRFVVPGHVLRFDARYAEVKRHLDAGDIGRVLSLFSTRARPQSQLAVHGRTHTAFVLMPHDIDLALWWTGSRVQNVRAFARRVSDEARVSAGDAPDVLWANLEFDNGALAVLQSSWLLPGASRVERADVAEVTGERGLLQVQTSESGFAWWSDDPLQAGRHSPDLSLHYPIAGHFCGALREQFAYLCVCIRNQKAPLHLSFDDAVHGVEIAAAIVQSAATGRDVALKTFPKENQ